jgi:hypothetical protein
MSHKLLSFRSLSYDRSSASAKTSPHSERTSASAFNFRYLLVFLMSPTSYLRLLPRLPVTFIFPSITCFRKHFLHKMWPIQLAFLLFIVCTIFPSLTLCNTSFFTWRVQMIFSILLQHHITKRARVLWSTFQVSQVWAPYKAMHFTSFFLKFESSLLVSH